MGYKNKTHSNNNHNYIQDKVSQIDTLSEHDTQPIDDNVPRDDTQPIADYVPRDDTQPIADYVPKKNTQPIADYVPKKNTQPIDDNVPKKNTQPIEHTPSGKKSKLTVCDFYKDIFTNMTIPVSEQFISRLALDLVKWATEDEEALKLSQFLLKTGILEGTFYRWSVKYPCLKTAKEVAKTAIGNRREILALKNKLNASMVMGQMAKYDDSWKNLEEWRNELKIKAQQKQDSDIVYKIVVEDFSGKDEEESNNLPEGD